MMTLISAGGSGAQVLEAVLHLCAAGLGPDQLRVFSIDPDAANGNIDRVRKLVDIYGKCRSAFASQGQPFFRTAIDTLEGPQGLRVWSPVEGSQRFKQLLNYDGLDPIQRDVADLLFSKDELEMEMEQGFRGHPALGAAALSLLPLYSDHDLWKRFVDAIRKEVNLGDTRVMVVGSVFGGTGASAIHPIIRFVRNLPQSNPQNLILGAIALVPYFHFADSAASAKEKAAARSQWFALASRSAAEYYEHLRNNGDWDFNVMYWLGDDSPVEVPYSTGGPKQNNPAHFIDLLGGLTSLDFAHAPREALAPGQGTQCYYSGPVEDGDAGVVNWEAIPLASYRSEEVRGALHTFHLAMCSHLAFFAPVLNDKRITSQAYCVPWYLNRLAGKDGAIASLENQARLELLNQYLNGYYFPWWTQIHSQSARIRLLNPTSWASANGDTKVALSRLSNLLYPEDPHKQNSDIVDELFDATVRASAQAKFGNNTAATYLAMLAEAVREVRMARE